MGKFSAFGDYSSATHEHKTVIQFLKIIREAKIKAEKRFKPINRRVDNEKHSMLERGHFLNKTISANEYIRSLGILPDIRNVKIGIKTPLRGSSPNIGEDISKSMLNRTSTSFSSIRLAAKREKESGFDLMFKEITPENVLIKLGS